jgi:rRNA-processing protein EBP2
VERDRKKKEELEKIKLARKKQGSTQNADEDGFGIDLEDDDDKKKKSFGKSGGKNNKKNPKRAHKDSKYGFGGPKRNRKSNTADSTNDLASFSHKKMKGSSKKNGKVGKRQK